MKISIRIKIFTVLLAFSLGPILISRGLMGRASSGIIDKMSEQTRKELLHIVSTELEYNAVSLLEILQRGGKVMTLSVRTLAGEVGHVLSEPEPVSGDLPYFTIDFQDPDLAPPDAVASTKYLKRAMSGKVKPIKVSFDHPTAHLPRGVLEKDVLGELRLLHSAAPILKTMVAELMDMPIWFNIALESGAMMTYPGHGDMPSMYDPRNQEWYQQAKAAHGHKWSATVDPVTRSIVSSVAYPIRASDGTFLGAVSIDIPTSAMMPNAQLKAHWEGDIKSFLTEKTPDVAGKGLPILAQQESDKGGRRHWMTGVEQEWLSFDEPVGTEILMHAMAMKESGVVPLSYKGEPSVCAFASDEEYSFLLIASESVVAKLPNEVSGALSGLFDDVRNISFIISGIMLVVTGLIAWFGSRALISPLLIMIDVARRLSGGDFSARMNTRTGDERDDLIDSFNEMGPKLKQLMQLNKDMELAEEVQRLLLPRSEPCLKGFDISGGIAYCDQTGGDYYDFVESLSREGRALGVVIGDVSGHGVPSALVMAAARGQLHTLSSIVMEPQDRINSINKVLSRDLFGTGRFLTLFYLRIRGGAPSIKWVRAGHDPAIRFNPATGEFDELMGDGIPLGVQEEYVFKVNETTLEMGEVLVMATDGVWEARNAEGIMFGKERMLAIIRQNAHKNAEEIRLALMRAVDEYRGNAQEDDIAVVVVKKTGDMSMAKDSMTFRMTNKQNCFKCFHPKVESFCAANGLHQKITFHLTLVLDELVTNIIDYGYTDFDVHPIDVSIFLDGEVLTIRVEDDSEPFNILEAPEPQLDLPLDERDRQVGGMGIHLIKNMVHGIEYKREGEKNVLTLRKNISKAQCPGMG